MSENHATETHSPLRVEHRETHIHATLNRPEKRNAMDLAAIDALHELCTELERTPQTLIFSGAGGNFAAGADIAQLRDRRGPDALTGINTHAFMRVAALPMPVIAVLDGYALGGGAELAYAADIRLGTTGLRIGNPETNLGILAGAGATWRLPELVGAPLTAEMLLAGRILTGPEAFTAGLITHLHDSLEEALSRAEQIAARIAALDPQATRATKRVLRAPREAHPAIDFAEQATLFESPEKLRRMTEFLERTHQQ
ncbi:enoyl-CoA hydratase-related protein [Leucobacter sp. BZR 635]